PADAGAPGRGAVQRGPRSAEKAVGEGREGVGPSAGDHAGAVGRVAGAAAGDVLRDVRALPRIARVRADAGGAREGRRVARAVRRGAAAAGEGARARGFVAGGALRADPGGAPRAVHAGVARGESPAEGGSRRAREALGRAVLREGAAAVVEVARAPVAPAPR